MSGNKFEGKEALKIFDCFKSILLFKILFWWFKGEKENELHPSVITEQIDLFSYSL